MGTHRGRLGVRAVNLLRAIRYARRYRNWAELTRIRDAGRKPRAAVLRCGVRFEAPEDVNVLRVVTGSFLKPRYTPDQFEIGESDVVVDVGANIGVYSLYANFLYPEMHIYAFEPVERNFKQLHRNKKFNEIGNRFQAMRCAIGNKTGDTFLDIPDMECGSTGSQIRETVDEVIGTMDVVPIYTIDDLASK